MWRWVGGGPTKEGRVGTTSIQMPPRAYQALHQTLCMLFLLLFKHFAQVISAHC